MADWRDLGLSDNPFDPAKELPGVADVTLLQDLVTAPLQVHVEPNLKPLYCTDLGPFRAHLKKFRDDLQFKGYAQDPPTSGKLSFVFTIRGPKGSGKSSLANMMVDWLKGCIEPDETGWDVEERFRDDPRTNVEEQQADIRELQEAIEQKAAKHHCIILDNLIAGADRIAYAMWEQLRKTRRIVLFLIADDLPILRRGFTGINAKNYVTAALSAEDGVKFVKHRMSLFRVTQFPWLAQYPLFPFSESDIRDVLAPRNTRDDMITLRQLSVYLSEALKAYLLSGNDFDPSAASEQEIPSMLIDIEKMVAELAMAA